MSATSPPEPLTGHGPGQQRSPYPPVLPAQKWGLFAVLVVAALLRLHGLGHMSLWYDEACSLFFRQFATLDGALMDPRNTSEPPVMAVLTRLWYGAVQAATDLSPLSPASDFLIRLLPSFFGVLGVYAVFLAARVLTRDNGAALGAAFFCAISPFQVHYGQELRVYSVYMVVSLAVVFCMVRAMEENRARWWAGLAASEALLLYTHFSGVWTLLFINLAFIAALAANQWNARAHVIRWYGAQAVAFVLALPAMGMLLRTFGHMSAITVPWYQFDLTWKTPLITFKAFFAGYGFTVWAYWGLFALAAVLCLVGAVLLRRRPALLLILLLAVGPLVVNVAMWQHRDFSFYHHRMFIFSAAMAYVLAGAGLRALGRPRFVATAVLLTVALTLPCLRDHYTDRIHPIEAHRAGIYNRADFRAAAAHITAHAQPGDTVAAANHFVTMPLRHYLGHDLLRLSTERWETQTMMDSHGHDALLYRQRLMPRLAHVALHGHDRVWFVESEGITFEFKPHTDAVRAWLDAHYAPRDDRRFHGVRLTEYGPRTEAPAP